MNFKNESELAEVVIGWLENQKYDVYQEVELRNASGIADIVAVQNKIVWVIECKLSFGLSVISQAFGWKPYANLVSVATPPTRQRAFGTHVLRKFGIGYLSTSDSVFESLKPEFSRKARRDSILKVLSQEHKTYAKAGNNHGMRWTPFQSTCRNVLNEVRTNPGINLKTLIESISTHYGSTNTARQCLRIWIEKGVVPGVRFERDGRNFRIFPI